MNQLYPFGRAAFAVGGVNWPADTIQCILLTSGYTFNPAHEFITDLGANIVARIAMSSLTQTSGICSAGNTLFSALTGSAVASIVVAKYTGSDATSRLIKFFDTASSLPFTPDGSDRTVVWSGTGSSGVVLTV